MKFTPHRLPIILSLIAIISLAITGVIMAQGGDPETSLREAFFKRVEADIQAVQPVNGPVMKSLTPCSGGTAAGYPCQNIDLLAHMPLNTIGAAGDGNDIWGWTDPLNNKEYALMGVYNGTSFIDITDPENPIYLGLLPTHTSNSIWRDIKVYNNYAFVVSEASSHGMQVFDLTQLRNVTNPPVTFAETTHYNTFGSAHNIVINEDTGYAYAVGGNCSGGLHMVNIQDPENPTFAGCVNSDGYTHDAQCILYNGPDTAHLGQEICFNSNEDTLTIFDVTVKSSPVQLSRTGYSGYDYTHQGWVTEDHKYFLLDDEGDEQTYGHNTRTYIWDISDLDNPVLIGTHTSSIAAIDHNQYIKGQYSYQANYRGGLRILDISDIANGNLNEVAYFDTFPSSNSASFNGAWSVYPYFASGNIIVSDIESGLFVLRPKLPDISLSKTVGTDPNVCAAESSIVVNAGTEVTYCYTVENTGTITLTSHSLEDDKLGTLLSGYALNLAPGEQYLITQSVVITQDTVNTAVWTASVNSQSIQATDSATVLLTTPAITLGKSAGTNGVCAGNDITVIGPTTITYCYTITNVGNVPLNTHSLFDDQLGQLFTNTTYNLSVNDSYSFSVAALISATTVNSATWSAWQSGSLGIPAQASSVATVTVIPINYGLALKAVNNALYGIPAQPVTYTLWLTNNGNISDSFDITISNNAWNASAPATVGPLATGNKTSFELTVTVPQTAANNDSDSLSVYAVSQGDTGTSANVMLTTTAITPVIYNTLTATVIGGGVVTPTGGSYISGTSVLLTANANPGWTFSGWSGSIITDTTPYLLLMDSNKVITAIFVGSNKVYLPIVLK